MPTVTVLLLLAGLSEAAGRLLPVVSRHRGASPRFVAASLAAGALVEAAVFSSWPWLASTLADRVDGGEDVAVGWAPGMVAPLLLAAVLAFPMLGPFLHAALVTGVGISLSQALDAGSEIGLSPALTCVAAAGTGLTLAVAVLRRVVAWALSPPRRAALP